jgi:hypothetical protein
VNGNDRVPAVVLGGSGYVAGELLRLLAGHPSLAPVAVVSESQAGESVEASFPHLAGCYPGLVFQKKEALGEVFAKMEGGPAAVFCAAPHGAAAGLLDGVLAEAEAAGVAARAVRRRTRRSTGMRTARRSGWRRSSAVCRSMWQARPRHTSAIRAASRRRCSWRLCRS